jgi:HEAT repeat protein
MALGRLLAAQAPDGDLALLSEEKAGTRLLAGLKRAPSAERAFVALALGVATGPVDHTVDSGTWQAFRFDAIEALRDGTTGGADTHLRAAHCVGLGLARDRHSGPQLLALLEDRDASPELRAYAALGLGLLGDARHGVVPALTAALESRRSELVRMRAATALGLLGGGNAKEQEAVLDTLVGALQTTRSQRLKGQIAVTLGRIGDARAVKPLADILEGRREAKLNRAIACAALGLVGDEEIRPLLATTREDAHYLAGASVVKEILDLL